METTVKAGMFAQSEYQWVLDLSAGLNGLAISDSQEEEFTAVPAKREPSASCGKFKTKALETVAQLDPVEVSSISSGSSISAGSSAGSSAGPSQQHPADEKALMRAWGYPSADLQHFRQT